MASLSIYPTATYTMQDGSVCGPDFEYAPEFVAFRSLVVPQEERQVGDSVLPAREPDWDEVLATGSELLKKTRDVRILIPIICAAVHRQGLPALANGLQLLADWLEGSWNELHPRLEIEGELDPLLRSNAIAELADPSGLMRVVRGASFVQTPVGRISVGDVEKLLKGGVLNENAVVHSVDALKSVIDAEAERSSALFSAIEQAHLALERVQHHLHKNLSFELLPNLRPLGDLLLGLVGCLPVTLVHETTVNAIETNNLQPLPVSSSSMGLPLRLESRSDAYRALALARQFFEEYEPSHPASLLIRRIEDLQGKDFLSLVRELTPDGLVQLRVLTGRTEESAS